MGGMEGAEGRERTPEAHAYTFTPTNLLIPSCQQAPPIVCTFNFLANAHMPRHLIRGFTVHALGQALHSPATRALLRT